MKTGNTAMLLLSTLMAAILAGIPTSSAVSRKRPPNILVLLADDFGIGDVGCYGNSTIKTPNIDRLAAEGVKLNHHLAAAPLCTPSRAAMLTGRYPARYGLVPVKKLEVPVIINVASRVGLPLEEVTLATALKAANYTTAIVGKWHLGMNCSLFGLSCPGPLNHGFDTFYGIPVTLFVEFRGDYPFWVFSILQTKFQALAVTGILCLVSLIWASKRFKWRIISFTFLLFLTSGILFIVWFGMAHALNPITMWGVSRWLHKFANSMIMRQDKLVEKPIILDGLSQRLVAESRQFLADHANDDKPFFLFHSFAHVHTPMFTAPHRVGKSKHGRYGDNVEEMDESIGVLLDSLKEYGLEDDTIVYFTSDQGGALESIDENGQRTGGYNGLFKGGKSQGSSEGAIRVPGIYRWPGHLPKGIAINTPTNLMDLMPTVLELSGLPVMQDLVPRAVRNDLDGQSIANLLKKGDVHPMEERIMIHHCRQDIHALRLTKGNHVYKMHLAKVKWHKGSTQCGWSTNKPGGCSCFERDTINITETPELYDLSVDTYEDHPIDINTHEYKEIVAFLRQYLKNWQDNVYYPPPPMSNIADVMWRPMYQPLCWSC